MSYAFVPESQSKPPAEGLGGSGGLDSKGRAGEGSAISDPKTGADRSGKVEATNSLASFDDGTLDLRPVRDVVSRLAEIWGEVERFVLALLDGWSVVLHQLATHTEQRVTSAEWLDQVLRHLRRLDHRFAQLAAGLDQLQVEMQTRESLKSTRPPASEGEPLESELPPFIVPIRPENRPGSQSQEGSSVSSSRTQGVQPTMTAAPIQQGELQTEVPAAEKPLSAAPTSSPRLEELLRSWASLAEQLDELLPRTPEEI